MLKGVIVDDEKPAIDILKRLLEKSEKIDIIKTFDRAIDAIMEIPKLEFDVVFLDIDMPQINGIELAKNIMSLNKNIQIVFVTAYEQYAVDAFRIDAIDYLLKPILRKHINETIDRLVKRRNATFYEKKSSDNIHKIYCFGAFEVYSSLSKEPIKWRTSKSKELFAYLFQNRGISIPKWRICEEIWPEIQSSKVDVQLHTTIYKMKKTLISSNIKAEIKFINRNYILEMPQIYSDVDEFDKIINSEIKITQENIETYEKIISLYKNNFLEENEYMWSIYIKENYVQKYLIVAVALVNFYIKDCSYDKAIFISKKVLKILPYDEEFHEILLKLYIEKNDRVSFINHYNLLLKLFKSELGIEPDSAIKKLYSELI